MAGYSTINAQFRPMSYQEMIAPVAAADTEHKAVEEQEAQLQTLASQWKEKLANLGPNSQARKLYEGYMDEINKQSELLSSQGLTPGARKSLAGLKARYSSDIVPIEEAYKKTQTNQQLIQQMKAKDSSYITDNNLTIDDYLKNPNATFNGLSLNEVEENAGRAFAEVAKKALTNGTFKKTLGGQYWERAVKNGYAEKVLHQLQSNPDDTRVPQELRDLYKNSITDYMSRGNWGESGKKSIINAINKASFRALESYEKPEMLSNKQWEYDMAEKKAQEVVRLEAPNYTPIPKDLSQNTNNQNVVKTHKEQQDYQFVTKIINNPDFINSNIDLNKKYNSTAMPNFFKPTQNDIYSGNYKPGTTDDYMAGAKRAMTQKYNRALSNSDTPTNEGVQYNKQRIQELMHQYKVNDLNSLQKAMQDKISRTASVANNYQFELANNDLAFSKLKDRFSTKATTGNSGIWESSKQGTKGKLKLQADLNDVFDSKNTPTLMINTDQDEINITSNGTPYILDANVLDASGRLQKGINTQKDLKNRMLRAKDQDSYDLLAQEYNRITVNNAEYMGHLLNQFKKTQSSTEKND